MQIGKNYAITMRYIEGYKKRFVEYIESHKDEGYISLESDNPVDENTVIFKMGQHKFALEILSMHFYKTILFKTYKLPKFPETNISYIKEMEITCEGIGDNNRGFTSFRVPKEYMEYGTKFTHTSFREFNEEYLFFLDQYISTLYK